MLALCGQRTEQVMQGESDWLSPHRSANLRVSLEKLQPQWRGSDLFLDDQNSNRLNNGARTFVRSSYGWRIFYWH